MSRTSPLRRRTPPLRQVKIHAVVWDRDHMQCNRCAYVTYSAQIHHRRLKGMGGDTREHTDCPCNLIVLCPPCHEHIHNRGRVQAEAEGLIVSRWQEPGLVAVKRYSTTSTIVTQWPGCDGGWLSEGVA